MKRPRWPALMFALTLVVFASHLAYTQLLASRVRSEARIQTVIYAHLQRALTTEHDAQGALLRIRDALQRLDVPTLFIDPAGRVIAAENLPFDVDLAQPAGQRRARAYADRLARLRPDNTVEVIGFATVRYGDPPVIGWLGWVPWLQLTVTLALVVVAFSLLRTEARAERERVWSSMARELAHQLGTPLSSLAGWVEVLRLPADERSELASTAHIAEVMGADIERLGRVSHRFELVGKPPVLRTTSAAALVEELEAYFRPRLPRIGRGIRMRSRIEADLPPVRANAVLLAWALENVVKNAIDALAGRGGRILILAGRGDERHVHIRIADDGPGISSAVRERIFDAGVTTKTGGWGVGLSLARRIVEELHGGRIEARARPRGGTIFDIALPVAGAAPERTDGAGN